MVKFHQLMNLSSVILMNARKTAVGIIAVKTIFAENGNINSKNMLRKNSKIIKIGTRMLQKIHEASSRKLVPGIFKTNL
jgi:hypothetical protein